MQQLLSLKRHQETGADLDHHGPGAARFSLILGLATAAIIAVAAIGAAHLTPEIDPHITAQIDW